jgi:hypothetical protein
VTPRRVSSSAQGTRVAAARSRWPSLTIPPERASLRRSEQGSTGRDWMDGLRSRSCSRRA